MSGSPELVESFKFVGRGYDVGLHAISPMSVSMSIPYFLCCKMVPSAHLNTSMPRKYLSPPRSLIVKALSRPCLSCMMPLVSFPVINTSSTCTNNAMNESSLPRVNRE